MVDIHRYNGHGKSIIVQAFAQLRSNEDDYYLASHCMECVSLWSWAPELRLARV